MRALLSAAACLAAGCLVLTGSHALRQPMAQQSAAAIAARKGGDGEGAAGAVLLRCAIYHARFGGTRARLVKLIVADVANYVVMEVARASRQPPTIPLAWLSAAFSGAEPSWLGEFASPESALKRAADLCPEIMRCRIGEVNCGPHVGQ